MRSTFRFLVSCRWCMPGVLLNKIQKILNGNRNKKGYKFALWNCGRGLLSEDGQAKITEVQQFIDQKRPHCFGIIESDLFGVNSDKNRKKYTTSEINEKLKIDGYSLELPFSWNIHGQARILCYVSNEVKYARINLNNGNDHLPSITLSVGLGRATKTLLLS